MEFPKEKELRKLIEKEYALKDKQINLWKVIAFQKKQQENEKKQQENEKLLMLNISTLMFVENEINDLKDKIEKLQDEKREFYLGKTEEESLFFD